MPLNWIDVKPLSINALLLLERVQLSWFPGWVPEADLAIALRANPVVEWYVRHKCPEITQWLDGVLAQFSSRLLPEPTRVRKAEESILNTINDLVVYALDPAIYDAQPFLDWDSNELTSLLDFTGKVVIDIGSGTGRLAFAIADKAAAVFPIEPVSNLRYYIRDKARNSGYVNVFPVDGLITQIPFPDGFADVTMSGHVFGDKPEQEYREMSRVTKTGGRIILCPGTSASKKAAHTFLLSVGFSWSSFEEPGKDGGTKRKYWKILA